MTDQVIVPDDGPAVDETVVWDVAAPLPVDVLAARELAPTRNCSKYSRHVSETLEGSRMYWTYKSSM